MINSDYQGEIGVVLFNHSVVDFPVQVGDRIAQLILEKVKTPATQKVIVLSAIDKGSGGFGSTGLQSSGSSSSVIQKENRAEKSEKVQKERMLEGSKEKITPSSHTVSRQGEAEPSFGGTSGTLRQTTNQDCEVTVVVPEVDVVYPLYGDSVKQGESTSGYPAGELPINRPSERHPKSDGGGISSVVRI